jgi:hypothetical protein
MQMVTYSFVLTMDRSVVTQSLEEHIATISYQIRNEGISKRKKKNKRSYIYNLLVLAGLTAFQI